MALYTKHFVICPWCDGETRSSIDHLLGKDFRTTWYCDHCRKPYNVVVTAKVSADVAVEISRAEDLAKREQWSRTMTLLKFDGKDGPVYFVMDHDAYSIKGDADYDMQGSLQYYFEEHSCPTNWLRECVAVIEGGDADPHGFLEFVRAVEVPRDFDDDHADWFEVFPETRPEPDFTSPIAEGNRMRAFETQPCPVHGASCAKVGGGMAWGLDTEASTIYACGTETRWQTGDDPAGRVIKRNGQPPA